MPSKILLIHPSMQPHWSRCQPYGLMMLAALIERFGHEVRILDFNVEPVDFGTFSDSLKSFDPQWVGISAVTIQAIEGYRIGNFVKQVLPNSNLIYGGIHPTFEPHEPFKMGSADFVLKGESFETFPNLINGTSFSSIPNLLYRENESIKETRGEISKYDLDLLPAPAFHLLDNSQYGMNINLEGYWDEPAVDYMSSLGCPFSCDFCASPAIYHRKVRFRSIDNVISDLEYIKQLGINNIHIHDDDFLIREDRVQELCQAIIDKELNINWICLATIRMVIRRQNVLSLMREAGCVGIEIGVETGDEEALKLVTKKVPKNINGAGKEAVGLIREAGITPILLMISYNIGETIESAYLSAKHVYELKLGEEVINIPKHEVQDHLIAGHFLTIDPGTALYNRKDTISGTFFTDAWTQHINERINFIPDTILDDVPFIDYRWNDEEVKHLLQEYRKTIEVWIPANFYIPELVYQAFDDLDGFLEFSLKIYGAVDGKKTVRELFVAHQQEVPYLQIVAAAVCFMSILRLVRSAGPNAVCHTRRKPIPKSLRLEQASLTTVMESEESGKPFFCSRPWTGFEVGEEDGVVRMCCWAKDGYGNVNYDTIADIWNGDKIREMRRKMANGEWKDLCRTECPVLKGHMQDEKPAAIKSDVFYENYLNSLKEIKERAEVVESLPRFWKAAHSTLCNLDCIMCYQDRNNTQTLPDHFYEDLKNYYPYMQELMLLGGEPFAIKKIRNVMADCDQESYPDMKFSIISNGTVYDAKTIDLVRKMPISWMLISVDAADADTYAFIRRKGDLEKTLEGIQRWKELSDELGFPLVLSFTVMKDNLQEITEFIKLSDKIGIDCQFFMVNGTKGGQHRFDSKLLAEEVDRGLNYLQVNSKTEMPIAWNTLSDIKKLMQPIPEFL